MKILVSSEALANKVIEDLNFSSSGPSKICSIDRPSTCSTRSVHCLSRGPRIGCLKYASASERDEIANKFDTMKDAEDPLKFAKQIRVRYPLAVATDALKQEFGGIEGLPTTLLYDRQGRLRKKVIGFEYTDAFEKDLTPLL